jgi:hypothetical protein
VEADDVGKEAEQRKLGKLEKTINEQKESGVDNIRTLRKLLDMNSDYKGKDDTFITGKLGLFRWNHSKDGNCVWIGSDKEATERAKKLGFAPPVTGLSLAAQTQSV